MKGMIYFLICCISYTCGAFKPQPHATWRAN